MIKINCVCPYIKDDSHLLVSNQPLLHFVSSHTHNNFISPFLLSPSVPDVSLLPHQAPSFLTTTFHLFLFSSFSPFPISFTQAVPCFVSHLETQAASNSNIFQQQVLAKALAATRSGPQTELCYWVNKGQLES